MNEILRLDKCIICQSEQTKRIDEEASRFKLNDSKIVPAIQDNKCPYHGQSGLPGVNQEDFRGTKSNQYGSYETQLTELNRSDKYPQDINLQTYDPNISSRSALHYRNPENLVESQRHYFTNRPIWGDFTPNKPSYKPYFVDVTQEIIFDETMKIQKTQSENNLNLDYDEPQLNPQSRQQTYPKEEPLQNSQTYVPEQKVTISQNQWQGRQSEKQNNLQYNACKIF